MQGISGSSLSLREPDFFLSQYGGMCCEAPYRIWPEI